MNTDTTTNALSVIDRVAGSRHFSDYDRAFRKLTRLPLAVAAKGVMTHALSGDAFENPFSAALLAGGGEGCEKVLELQRQLHHEAQDSAASVRGFDGLVESALPLREGGELIGWLRTGQVFVGDERPGEFTETRRWLAASGKTPHELRSLDKLWRASPLVDREAYDAAIDLLAALARIVEGMIGNLGYVDDIGAPAQIERAKRYIRAHYQDEISLADAARIAGMSTNYFSSRFRNLVGMTFTEFVARTRIGIAKQRLLDPGERVCETAFDVGFRSLSQFNRSFRKVVGESPSGFRTRHGVGGKALQRSHTMD